MHMLAAGRCVRLVEDAFRAGKDECVVDNGSSNGTNNGANDGGVEPVLAAVVPNLSPVAGHPAHQTGAEVTSGIERISSLHSKACTFTQNSNKQNEWNEPIGGWAVAFIGDGENHNEKDGSGQDFRKEALQIGHVVGRESSEERRSARNSSDTLAAFKEIDGPVVVGINETGTGEGAQDLRQDERGNFFP